MSTSVTFPSIGNPDGPGMGTVSTAMSRLFCVLSISTVMNSLQTVHLSRPTPFYTLSSAAAAKTRARETSALRLAAATISPFSPATAWPCEVVFFTAYMRIVGAYWPRRPLLQAISGVPMDGSRGVRRSRPRTVVRCAEHDVAMQ